MRQSTTAAVALAAVVLYSTVLAQDLEPRAYSNSPTGLNFVLAGYGYAKGSVLTDPSLPLDNVTNNTHVGVFAYATTPSASRGNIAGEEDFEQRIDSTDAAKNGPTFRNER